MNIYTIEFFYDLLFIMFVVGLVVFVSLYFVDAGYGKMRSETSVINGKAQGLEQIYYETGELRDVSNYVNDMYDGKKLSEISIIVNI